MKKKKNNILIFKFHFLGKIILFCDITNNKYNFKINKKKKLKIIFSKKKQEYNDNYLILPLNYKIINISKYIYESILLMIPLKKIDPKIKKIIY
ncbi:MAG: YceD family protein [Candidatus Shikimatogenerans bostrichidophilus]|nr:MAG: YceD family protein [Candidatus Shikimatogenerans bostrichidophilus]